MIDTDEPQYEYVTINTFGKYDKGDSINIIV